LVEFLAELWRRALSVHPAPSPSVLVALALGALALVLFAWPLVRLIITVCHEGGHALAALLAGRKLSGIRLHTDTSGLTLTRGRPTGLGMAFTFFAGYPAAALLGLGVAWLAGEGYAAGALWLIVALLAVMLINIRNFYGALVVLGLGGLLALASWFAPPEILSWIAIGLAWLLLFGAPRPVFEVAANRNPGTDSAQLARLTRLPRAFWITGWLLLTVGALVLGTWLLLPALRP
jgi:hypothetical protein